MSISSNSRKAGPFVGNGTASTFPFAFKVFQASDLEVVKLTVATSVETILVLNTDYSASLNEEQNSNPGGSITLLAGPLATGFNLVVTSSIQNLQPTDITNQGGFYPSVINDSLDRATIQIQQLQEAVDRSAKLPITSAEDADALVADIVRLADSAGNIDIVAGSIANVNIDAAAIANINTVAGSITNVNITGANIANVNAVGADLLEPVSEINTVAVDIANVNTVGTNITSVNTAATNIAAIIAAPTHATAAAASATAAAGSASSAATSATSAASSASAASSSATASASSATAAASSAITAQTAATAAEAALDEFTDTYLGPKASDPIVDNDGGPLTAGDWYFNTTSNISRIYNGSTWDNLTVNPATVVVKTSATGSAALPTGTTGQRDGSPATGYLRFNSTLTAFEGYNGTAWGLVGGGATGGGQDQVFMENQLIVTTNYTLSSGKSAVSVGPITVNGGVVVTVPGGHRWVIL